MPHPLIKITRQHALIFAAFLVLYEFLTYIANDMIMPGMLSVVASFHGPESAVASSLTAYMLGGASLQLLLGPLSDAYGRRPVMITGAIFFFICTVFIGCSFSMNSFLFARFVQGMGLCFIGVVGYATLQEIFAEMDAIRLIAIMANVSILAPLLGPMLGAVFIHYFHWRFIFAVIGSFALLALWGLWYFMPESVGELRRDGERIPLIPLEPRKIFKTYIQLITTPSILCGSIGIGLLSLPCVAWIALAPIIMVKEGQMSLLGYGLWQIPVFSASIVGNWTLHHMTHRRSLVGILWLGSLIVAGSLGLMFILPVAKGSYFLWLMPGLMLYFWGLSMAGAPINRLVLFSTNVGKGTTSAFISMVSMVTQALGIEVANHLYQTHNNVIFGAYCGAIGVAYLLFVGVTLRSTNVPKTSVDL